MTPGRVFERTRQRAAQHGVAAALAFLVATASQAATSYEESLLRAPVAEGARRVLIDVTVFKPQAAGPFPIVVLSHGSPRNAEDRRLDGRQRLSAQAEPFIAMGYAVLVPTRRGYGESGGDWAEGYGLCRDPDYYAAGLESARDIRAAVDAVRGESWADTRRVVLAGQSAGGFGSVAASAAGLDGLVGVVNFAGGRGSRAANDVCAEERLVEAMSRYGRSARVPELWLYSANDRFFAPALAQRMFEAFVAAGGNARLVQTPPVGLDGHAYFARAIDDWTPRVRAFLAHLPGL
jgi:dienelactone hydrolase